MPQEEVGQLFERRICDIGVRTTDYTFSVSIIVRVQLARALEWMYGVGISDYEVKYQNHSVSLVKSLNAFFRTVCGLSQKLFNQFC